MTTPEEPTLRFQLHIDLKGSACAENPEIELTRALQIVASKVVGETAHWGAGLPILDSNGNTVGAWEIVPAPEYDLPAGIPQLSSSFDPEHQGSPEGKAIAQVMQAAHRYWVAMETEPHAYADAEAELAAETLALAARDLVKAVEAQRPGDRPVGWSDERWLTDPSTVDASSIKTPGYVLYSDDTSVGYRNYDNALHVLEATAKRTVTGLTDMAARQGWDHLSYGYVALTGMDWEISGSQLKVKPGTVKLSELRPDQLDSDDANLAEHTALVRERPLPAPQEVFSAAWEGQRPPGLPVPQPTWLRFAGEDVWHLIRTVTSEGSTAWCGESVRPASATAYEVKTDDRIQAKTCTACTSALFPGYPGA